MSAEQANYMFTRESIVPPSPMDNDQHQQSQQFAIAWVGLTLTVHMRPTTEQSTGDDAFVKHHNTKPCHWHLIL